ncbi:MAG TPA: Gfo/Idh/MocA family oxidoreductase [Dermatophilaceae bacterium]|nr:Gfo/Idh/MocA family oxidoreductase [Dermatophilaceae bacterium]
MTDNNSIGVAVIGAGMAGRSHAHAYRTAQTVFGTDAPPVRLVAIADVNEEFARHTQQRYGFQRAETSWQAVAEANDIDAVSIVVANHLHREIAEGLLAAGKHVLCEKPLAPSVADAEAMVAAAQASGKVASTGFSYRRSPAVSAIAEQIRAGKLGELLHFNGRYWCDYSASPDAPSSWRYTGPLGSGALADLGSHLIDLSEQLCGPIVSISGAALPIVIRDRPVPLGAALGHAGGVALSDRREPVTNDDIATFVVEFANGAAGTFSISRVAIGHPNTLAFEVFGTAGAASWDLMTNAEFGFVDNAPEATTNGWRRVFVGPAHPYVAPALSMPFTGVGHGGQEFFTFQARSFLDQIAGLDRLPRQASFADGLRNLQVEEAIVEAAATGCTVKLGS